MREDQMTPEQRREDRRRKNPMIHQFEGELRARLDLSEADFRRVGRDRWRSILEQLANRFADRTRDRKRDLHWANTNGYSPWAMDRLAGCWHTDCRSCCRKTSSSICFWSRPGDGSGSLRGGWRRSSGPLLF